MSLDHPHPRLNVEAIRSRAADLGLTDARLCRLAGISLADLNGTPHPQVSIAVLVRLARVLGLSLDQLVGTGKLPDPPAEAERADAAVVLAALATYGEFALDDLAAALRWTGDRLDTAVSALDGRLATTAFRVAVTDQHIALTHAPDGLPPEVAGRIEADLLRRVPMDPYEAKDLLRLVRDKILEPFPEDPEFAAKPLAADRIQHLVRRGIAVPAPNATSATTADADTDAAANEDVGGIGDIHPDVMFALRLAAEPADDAGEKQLGAG